MNFFAPLRSARSVPCRSSCCQPARMPGSFCGSPAFMGKSVFGRKTVSRQSFFVSSLIRREALAGPCASRNFSIAVPDIALRGEVAQAAKLHAVLHALGSLTSPPLFDTVDLRASLLAARNPPSHQGRVSCPRTLCQVCQKALSANPYSASNRRASAQSRSICSISASRESNFASGRMKWCSATSISCP